MKFEIEMPRRQGSIAEARNVVFECIEILCNRERPHLTVAIDHQWSPRLVSSRQSVRTTGVSSYVLLCWVVIRDPGQSDLQKTLWILIICLLVLDNQFEFDVALISR